MAVKQVLQGIEAPSDADGLVTQFASSTKAPHQRIFQEKHKDAKNIFLVLYLVEIIAYYNAKVQPQQEGSHQDGERKGHVLQSKRFLPQGILLFADCLGHIRQISEEKLSLVLCDMGLSFSSPTFL